MDPFAGRVKGYHLLRQSTMATARPIGIDLGTTNSCAATIDEAGRSSMVRNAEGDLLTPSVVLFDETEVVVGREARRVATLKPGQVAEWVKRDMGSPVYSRPIRGEYLPPEVIQACILRKLKSDAVAALGPDLQAVITVPAYFDEPRRKATADAGEMAGLTVLDIVNEPTAAALAFGEALGYLAPGGAPRDEMTVAVYDLGGGTFDATLLRLAQGDIRTLATDGDVQLGGFDWDMRLLNHAADNFRNSYGVDPRDDPSSWQRLFESVLEAKHSLSARSRATIRVEHAGRSAEIQVSREEFQEMTADLLERTAYTTRQLMTAAKLQWSALDRVLLVGGSTRMPAVPRLLADMTSLAPDHTVNPDEAVARGAAIYAHYLLSRQTESAARPAFQVTDVNSHSLGIEGIDPETLRKTNVILIPRNTPLPTRFTHRFMTRSENQRSIVIQVLEGESTLPTECNPIGRTVIRELPAGLPKAWPVEVTFEYARNGRLGVRAVVPGTQRDVSLDLERERGLSSEGVCRWRQAVCGAGGFDAFENMLTAVLQPMPPGAAASAPPAGPDFVPLPPAPPPGVGGTLLESPPAPAGLPIASAPEPLFRSQPSPLMTAGVPMPGSTPPAPPSPALERTAEYQPSGLAPTVALGREVPPLGPLQPIPEPQAPVPTIPEPGVSSRMPLEGVVPPGATPELDAQARVARRNRLRYTIVNFVGYVISAVVGLAAGYFIIRWLVPGIQLPSLFH